MTTDQIDDAVEADPQDSPVEPDADTTDGDTGEPEEDGFDPDKARDKIRKINSENRNLRKRAADAEAKAQEAEGKGEQLTKLEAENLRLRIAVKHGLPEKLVSRLTGTTEDEILQDAEELMELFGGRKPPTQAPKESLRSPGSAVKSAADVDVDQVVKRVFEN